jgi:hypothetical protein
VLRRILSSVSCKVLIVLIIFLILEYFPVTGIFLMLVAGAFIAGLLVHLFLASVFVEAATGRIPRALILAPIIAYAGYYVAYFREGAQIEQMSKTLRTSNPGKLYDFDPTANSLVMSQAQEFVEAHDVPVVYESNKNFPEAYLSERLITRPQCKGIKRDTQNRIFTFGVFFNRVFQQNVCLLRFPERPTNKVVTVTSFGDSQIGAHLNGITEQTTRISIDDKIVGSFTRAFIWRLPSFPVLAIGCMLIDNPASWRCFTHFDRSLLKIDGIPESVDRSKYDDPVSVMLGIGKYTAADLSTFTGFNSNLQALDSVHQEPERVQNSVFDALDSVIAGQSSKLPFNLGYSVATSPDRLTPRAQGMARRFAAVVPDYVANVPNAREQLEALAVAIGALPHEAFVSVADPLFDVVKEDPDLAMKKYPMIYIRMGELGTAALPFYRDQILAGEILGWVRMFPVLAICRIGEADTDLIEELKRRYNSVDLQGGGDPGNYKTSLFVTLLKLGQKSFLQDNHPNSGLRDQWYAAVLAGEGLTRTGPNNCMPEDWPFTIYTTPEVAPGLKWSRNGWEPRS